MKRILAVFALSMMSSAAFAQTDMPSGLDSDQHLGLQNEANVSKNGSAESSTVIESDGVEVEADADASMEAQADGGMVDTDADLDTETVIDNSDDTLGASGEANLSNNGDVDLDDEVNIDATATGSVNGDATATDAPDDPAEGNYSNNVDEEDVHR